MNNYVLESTCVAYATPPGQSGVAILRLSGSLSAQIADRIFVFGLKDVSDDKRSVFAMQGYTCALGRVVSPETKKVVDQAILTRFIAPHSYTGEDVIEISIHGGVAVKRALLELCLNAGAVLAGPGEFTKRAFLNGKMDLLQAEAVMDLIQAQAKKASAVALEQIQGSISKHISEIRLPLLDIMARLELAIQYPEHEDSTISIDDVKKRVLDSLTAVEQLTDSYRQGRLIREGIRVVLAGRPNAGKSSLLNYLSGMDRSIVTHIPGTTRDVVHQEISLSGIPVVLIDTAGLRQEADEIEKIGIGKAHLEMNQADIVFWILAANDPDWKLTVQEVEQSQVQSDIHQVLLISKTDLVPVDPTWLDGVKNAFNTIISKDLIFFSNLSGEGIDTIRTAITNIYTERGSFSAQEVLITNERQFLCIQGVEKQLKQLNTDLDFIPFDVISIALQAIAETLAELTGEVVQESVMAEIFNRFCVGK